MVVKLYHNIVTCTSRAVIYALEALNIPYESRYINLQKNQQFSEEFLKINIQHTIPTIEDEDGFILWDSHAINAYLVGKYGKDDQLYPKDLKARGIVDQRLHFDSDVLFGSLIRNIKYIIVNEMSTRLRDDLRKLTLESYDLLEKLLEGKLYAAGNHVTIADFSILTTLTNSHIFVPIDNEKYPLIVDYMKRAEANIPGFLETEKEARRKIIEILKALNFEFEFRVFQQISINFLKKKMPLKLYYYITSTPSRSVIHTLNALNAPYEAISLNLRDHEQLKEDFIKINPHHTVPTIQEEDGYILWESHAINGYLVKRYGKTDTLYRKDWKARGFVDQMLHYHNGVLFASLKSVFRKVVKEKRITKITDELKTQVEEAYGVLEKYLADGRKFAVGNGVTIADFSIVPTLHLLNFFVPIKGKWPLIADYVNRVKDENLPGFNKLEEEAKQKFTEILKSVNYEL
ncbi:uncharacterized protein LOC135845185 [Planococcus citri]|uniref:uncharacterized protein LOC135845185 n=1 Tax=Planococcus citri TaxID=170843 RepID=UPI0031F999AC